MPAVLRLTVLTSLALAGCSDETSQQPLVDGGQGEPVTQLAPASEDDVPLAAVEEIQVEVPKIATDARALWGRGGTSMLPLLATFFQFVDLSGDELQGSFELLREISAAVSPDDPRASSVLTATRGFLRLPISAAVQFPGEASPASWKYALRLVVGLRASRELGPLLVDTVRSRTRGGLDPERDVIRNAVYCISYLAYLPGSSIVAQYARECRGLDSRILALEMLALLGDPEGAPVVIEMIETGDELRLIQPAARTLHILVGKAAEPTLVALLRRDEPTLQRAALGPLLSISTPSALRRIIALMDTTADRTTQRTIEMLLKRYGRPLELSAAELESLIRSSPEEAARRMAPYAHHLEILTEEDRRLSREDLTAVLEHWKKAGTLYTPEWSWVRDRHIVSIATPEDEPALEAVRRSVLRAYRTTALNEAHIVQRMILAIRARVIAEDREDSRQSTQRSESAHGAKK